MLNGVCPFFNSNDDKVYDLILNSELKFDD